MHNKKAFLVKPDGSVGYEFGIGLIATAGFPAEELIDAEAREAAEQDGAGSKEEIKTWRLVIPPSEDPKP